MLEKIQLITKRYIYRFRHDYLSLNNLVIGAGLLIALSWTWSSIGAMQQNYELQQNIDAKKQQLFIEELRVSTLELESKYYDSFEYQELAVRERLGKGLPGESLIIVPSTDLAAPERTTSNNKVAEPSNFEKWIDFLSGGQNTNLQK